MLVLATFCKSKPNSAISRSSLSEIVSLETCYGRGCNKKGSSSHYCLNAFSILTMVGCSSTMMDNREATHQKVDVLALAWAETHSQSKSSLARASQKQPRVFFRCRSHHLNFLMNFPAFSILFWSSCRFVVCFTSI